MISIDLYPICLLTVWFAADSASQLLLTLSAFPEAISVKVNTTAIMRSVTRRPATEYSVTLVYPVVVGPILDTNNESNLFKMTEMCIKKIGAALFWYTYVAEEANPHGCACTAHFHTEGGLDLGISHACQVHAFISALL